MLPPFVVRKQERLDAGSRRALRPQLEAQDPLTITEARRLGSHAAPKQAALALGRWLFGNAGQPRINPLTFL
jgi:hypothetical protein